MNLWLRLIWCLVAASFRPALKIPDDTSVLRFRVGLFDLDPSLHLNNGRYLTLMDLGRLDAMLRSGLWRAAIANKWVPIASSIMIRYRRELGFMQAFQLESRILCWDAHSVIMEQKFVFDSGPREGQIAAHALFKGGLYDRKAGAFVPIARLMQAIGVSAASPTPGPEVDAFLKADTGMKHAIDDRPALATAGAAGPHGR
jgi:acyl-CoA thioesterase FadM